jgi:serine/threonine-protein kinase
LLASDTGAQLSAVDKLTGPKLATAIESVEHALPELAQKGEAAAIATIAQWLMAHGKKDPGAPSMRVIEHPAVLDPLANAFLIGPAQTQANRDATSALLVQSGAAGARALCAARFSGGARQAGGKFVPSARARFIDALRAIGRDARPAISAVLEAIQPAPGRTLDPDLAVDMLSAVPDDHDDDAGTLASKFLRPDFPPLVCAAAVHAVALAWGDRARPLLVGSLDSTDDRVRRAAIEALARTDGIDEGALGRLEKIIGGDVPTTDEVRVAAIGALGRASAARAPAAAQLLHRLMARKPKLMSFFRGGRDPMESPPVVLGCARALIALDREGGEDAVIARAERTTDEQLRTQLIALLPD